MIDLDGHHDGAEISDLPADALPDHSDLEHHEHEPGRPGVVHVAEDGDASSQTPHATLIRSAHQLDLLIPSFDLPPDDASARGWACALSCRFDSHVGPALERPPRV
ncbi:MAG: hypothetical protein WCJ87_09315 [Burkholderiales bacterium]